MFLKGGAGGTPGGRSAPVLGTWGPEVETVPQSAGSGSKAGAGGGGDADDEAYPASCTKEVRPHAFSRLGVHSSGQGLALGDR